MQVKVAAIQMVSTPEVAENLAEAERLVAQAAAEGARLAVLPEYFCIMGRRDTDKVDVKEALGGPIQTFLAECARRHQITLVGGTVPRISPKAGRVLNTCPVYRPDGSLAAHYDKIHLFGFRRGEERFDEAATILPGRTPVVCDLDLDDDASLRVGLSICYDLRFPELYRQMLPVDLIVVPSAFTYTTGQAHWELLLRARAVENQCYLLAAAQGGTHPTGRRTWGHSMLVDPWGEIVSVLPEGPGVACGMLDSARIDEVRTSLPALTHRVL
ncbi:MAG: carbon-nitrogen hydrolase family protein [Burkholderiaceae bacterium]|nr:carbon-nitrogen hydrolase family protein [Burkholderiaceae bacterium]